MKMKNLFELDGISSNMNNPSQEPYTEIPSSSEEPPAFSSVEDEESKLDQILQIANNGLTNGDSEGALLSIIDLLSEKE